MLLDLSIAELKTIVPELVTKLPDSFRVASLSSLEHAGPNDIAVYLDRGNKSSFDTVAVSRLQQSHAAFILAESEIVAGPEYGLVNDSLQAFSRIVAYAHKKTIQQASYRSDYAQAYVSMQAHLAADVYCGAGVVVEAQARVGAGSFIGAQSYIGHAVVIGCNVIIHPGVKILERCIVGDGSIIHAGTVIGSDGFGYQVATDGLRKIPQIGIVRIGRQVEIGAQCMIDRASFDETRLEDCVKLDNGVHIAHNVIVGAGTAILAQTGIAGSTRIGRGCQIGGQVAIKDNLSIGEGVRIVSKSGVLDNIPASATVAGIPAIPFMQWKKLSVMLARLPELYKKIQQPTPTSFWKRLFN